MRSRFVGGLIEGLYEVLVLLGNGNGFAGHCKMLYYGLYADELDGNEA